MKCFLDGDRWVVVEDDFVDLQESAAVFVLTFSGVGQALARGGVPMLRLGDLWRIKAMLKVGGGIFEDS